MAGRAIAIEASFGNVFADLGFPDAAELDTKTRLAAKLNGLIAAQQLSEGVAAARLGVSQSKVAALKSYRLDGVSVESLMSLLLALKGRDETVKRK